VRTSPHKLRIADNIVQDPHYPRTAASNSLSVAKITDLERQSAAGERKAHVARELGVSQEMIYQHLRVTA